MAENWTPASWRRAEARQLPAYPDAAALAAAESRLAALPPLVAPSETQRLEAELAKVAAGRAFLLQGGDCAESFAARGAANIDDTFRLIERMATVLTDATRLPVVTIGRMAGQYAKPRSAENEEIGGVSLPSYRGDIVNGIAFDRAAREPNPGRMLQAHGHASATLVRLRALARDASFHVSHEALLLPYEEALTRRDAETGRWFDGSAHFLWIGDRTRFEGSAHVEFVRGIANPIGVKCGPGLEPDVLLRLLATLDPGREPGRVTLIARFGQERIAEELPPLIRAVEPEGRTVIWSCDPMHGNTVKSASGHKTRPFERILAETHDFFAICRAEGVHGGGIHCEMTGEDVVECTGGATTVAERDLADRYRSHCDPRLNAGQSIELATLVSEMLCEEGHGRKREAA